MKKRKAMNHDGTPDEPRERNAIEQMVYKAHNPGLADEDFVDILFNDGELVWTKAGPLLWKRTLHMAVPGLNMSFGTFPVQFGKHTCAFLTKEDAIPILELMGEEFAKATGTNVPPIQERFHVQSDGLNVTVRIPWPLNLLSARGS